MPQALPPQDSPHRRILRIEVTPKTWIGAVVVFAGTWVALKSASVLLVLVGALMLVGALNPLVAGLERRGCRRGLAIGLVFTLAFMVAVAGMFLAVPPLVAQVRALIEREPEIRENVAALLARSPLTTALADWLRDLHYPELLKDARTTLLAISMRAVEIVAYVFTAVFLALYIMIDRDRLRGGFFALVPRRHHVRVSRVVLNLETIVGGYIRGQVITCVLIGVFIFALLTAMRVPDALALAVLGGAMDVLPYVGVLFTVVPAVVAAYMVGPGVALTVLLLMLAYEEFESRVLVPWVYGRALRLPSSVIFFSLLVGGVWGGVLGALLALPVAAAVVMILEELRVDLPGEVEQAKDVEVRQKDAQEARDYEARAEAAPAVEASAIAVQIARERKEEEAHSAGEKPKE